MRQYGQPTRGNSIVNSFCGAIVGVLLALGSCVVLFWNEGVAVQTARSLDEGLGKVVTIDDVHSSRLLETLPQSSNGRYLVHLEGMLDGKPIKDELFGVSHANAIRLVRSVSMYQWKEESRQVSREGYDQYSGSRQVTKHTEYFYTKAWSATAVDSNGFHHPDQCYPPNPSRFPVESQQTKADPITAVQGRFSLGSALADQITWSSPLDVTTPVSPNLPQLPSPTGGGGSSKKWVSVGGAVQSYNPQHPPQIGDVQVRFSVTKPTTVSMIAELRRGGPGGGYALSPYQTEAGDALAMLSQGSWSAVELFEQAHHANTVRTWALRGVGWLLVFIGIRMLFDPLSAVVSVIPFFGEFIGALVGFGTTVVALLLSVTISLLVAGTAWFVYRPWLSVGLFVFAFLPLVYLNQQKQHRQAQQEHRAR